MAVIRLERKSRRWEQVWQGDSETAATIIAGRLESDGIQTRVHGDLAASRIAAWNLGGAWAISVPAGKAARARDLLRENDEAHNVIDQESGEGLTASQRLTIQAMALAAVAIAVAVLVLSVTN